MNIRLPWSQLKEAFQGEWIELVAYDWKWGDSKPRWGIVRNHAADRQALTKMIEASPSVDGALILYVGASLGAVTHVASEAAL